MNKRFVLSAVVVLALLIALGIIFFSSNGEEYQKTDDSAEIVNAGDPVDPTNEFYNSWLEAVASTTTSPVEANLLSSGFLSDSVREYITSALAAEGRTVEPVLCQSVTPNRLGVKVAYILDTKAQLLVIARGGEVKSSEIAVVDLTVVDGAWQISNISCSAGESGPEREFSFENEGFLLKSVPPPLNPDYWHIVFVENGQNGHTAPLFFSPSSMCITTDGVENVCDESQFRDATKVLLQGSMTEAGVDVKNVHFLAE